MTLHPADETFITSLQTIGFKGDAYALLRQLQEMYTGPLRLFHTWDGHVRQGITFLTENRNVICNFYEVVVAYGFHDAVLVPGAKGNERASSDFNRKVLCRGGVEESVLIGQDRLIMATTHSTDLTYEPWPCQQIADLDLVPLALPAVDFRRNTALLRQEAIGIDEAAFSQGVRTFFQGLLKRPSIYYMPLFRNAYEAKAQENLKSWVTP